MFGIFAALRFCYGLEPTKNGTTHDLNGCINAFNDSSGCAWKRNVKPFQFYRIDYNSVKIFGWKEQRCNSGNE